MSLRYHLWLENFSLDPRNLVKGIFSSHHLIFWLICHTPKLGTFSLSHYQSCHISLGCRLHQHQASKCSSPSQVGCTVREEYKSMPAYMAADLNLCDAPLWDRAEMLLPSCRLPRTRPRGTERLLPTYQPSIHRASSKEMPWGALTSSSGWPLREATLGSNCVGDFTMISVEFSLFWAVRGFRHRRQISLPRGRAPLSSVRFVLTQPMIIT